MKCTVSIISKNIYVANTVMLLAGELGFDARISDTANANINIIDAPVYAENKSDPSRCIYLIESGENIPKGIRNFLSKPFLWEDMRRAIMNVYNELYSGADNRIIISDKELIYSGKKLLLSGKELELFKYLYDRENTPVGREELMKNIWPDNNGGTNITDVYINYVRSKIKKTFGLDVIHSVRGIGYRFSY